MKNTTKTLLKLVNKDRAISDLLRMEQGSRIFMDFLSDIKDQTHLCHNWQQLTADDLKRISLLGGLKDRTLAEKALAEEYTLTQSSRRRSTGRVPGPTQRRSGTDPLGTSTGWKARRCSTGAAA